MNQHDEAIRKAEACLAEALRGAGFSWDDCVKAYAGLRLKGGLDAKIRAFEVQPWQMGGGDDPRADAASSFLESGRQFGVALEFSVLLGDSLLDALPRALEDLEKALVTLHTAMRVAGWSSRPSLRDIEVRAAHGVGYIYLTWGELFGPFMEQIYPEKGSIDAVGAGLSAAGEMKSGVTGRDSLRLAGLYFELEGCLAAKYGMKEQSLDTFANAAHQYARADDFQAAARVAEEASKLARELGVRQREERAYEMQSDFLLHAAEATAKPEEKSHLATRAALALFSAGALLADEEMQKANAADLITKGAELIALLPEGNTTVVLNDSVVRVDPIVLDALRKAEGLYEEVGDFRRADSQHYLRRRYARRLTPIWHPLFWLSLLLDCVWGYGTRPLRL
jgi:hypothetical protein